MWLGGVTGVLAIEIELVDSFCSFVSTSSILFLSGCGFF